MPWIRGRWDGRFSWEHEQKWFPPEKWSQDTWDLFCLLALTSYARLSASLATVSPASSPRPSSLSMASSAPIMNDFPEVGGKVSASTGGKNKIINARALWTQWARDEGNVRKSSTELIAKVYVAFLFEHLHRVGSHRARWTGPRWAGTGGRMVEAACGTGPLLLSS